MRKTASQQFAEMMRPKPRPIARITETDVNGSVRSYPTAHASFEINLLTDDGDRFGASISVGSDDDGTPMVLILIPPYAAQPARSIKIRRNEL